MANLSRISDVTRKIVEIVAAIILGIILLVVLFRVGVFIKEIISPTPPPAPTVAFGKLPAQSFPISLNQSSFTYTVNTLSGQLPTLPDRITVYKLQQPTPNLLGLQKAKDIAKTAKFINDPTAISDTVYKWTTTDPFNQSFTMNIQSFDFLFTGDYKTNTTVTTAAHMPDETTAQTVSQQFFDGVMPLPDYIDTSQTKTTLLAINGQNLIPASSLSTAQLIRFDYFPKVVDNLPIYTQNPTQSLIYTLVASGDSDYPQVVEAQYYHKGITSQKATYPLKTAQQAYDDLKNGKGFIAANPSGNTNINITDVTLGYYVDASTQQYLWPIIVFQGDQGFYAYVSAVQDQWIQNN